MPKKSPDRERTDCDIYCWPFELFLSLSWRPMQLQVDGRVSLCTPLRGWICVCSCASCSYNPKVLSQRKQSPGEMRLLVRSCSCCRCCHHEREEANRKTWLHQYCTGTWSTVWNLDVDQYESWALWFIDFLVTFQELLTIMTLISSKYSHLRDMSRGHSVYFMMHILTFIQHFFALKCLELTQLLIYNLLSCVLAFPQIFLTMLRARGIHHVTVQPVAFSSGVTVRKSRDHHEMSCEQNLKTWPRPWAFSTFMWNFIYCVADTSAEVSMLTDQHCNSPSALSPESDRVS